MTQLVTGGSGYFGSLLRDRLQARGEAVRVFDLTDAEERPEDVGFVKGDIRDERALAAACDGCEVVYHCVAQVPLAKDRQLFECRCGRSHGLDYRAPDVCPVDGGIRRAARSRGAFG